MNLELQVCALEQAKRLEELGICEISYFTYDCDGYVYPYQLMGAKAKAGNAYTSAELGEIITSEIGDWKQECISEGEEENSHSDGKGYFIFSWKERLKILYIEIEAHARAEFLIYLLENRDVNN